MVTEYQPSAGIAENLYAINLDRVPASAEVFGTHQLMLNDSSLREELRKEIVGSLVNASTAV